MEFVEVRGRSVEVAVAGALAELGIESEDLAEVEVISEGKKGFLGMGGEDAVVRVRPRPAQKKRRRRRRGKGNGEGKSQQGESKPNGGRQPAQQKRSQPKPQQQKPQTRKQEPKQAEPDDQDDDVAGQAERVESFLSGLVSAFGIESAVSVSTDKDVILATVDGDQAEALVGQKGAVMAAVQEVTRTVVQRRFHRPARVRVDIAGYRERRRQALAIYAERLATQVVDEGGEIMLEPMNAADRKVVHDTVGGIDGVRSYSEGEDPRRSVVIAKVSDEEE